MKSATASSIFFNIRNFFSLASQQEADDDDDVDDEDDNEESEESSRKQTFCVEEGDRKVRSFSFLMLMMIFIISKFLTTILC